jgi:hypothetical protein
MIACLARPFARSQPLGGHLAVPLTPKAGDELQRLQERTRLSETDVVNRAITLSEFIDAREWAGQEILIRDKKTRETWLVRLS